MEDSIDLLHSLHEMSFVEEGKPQIYEKLTKRILSLI